MSAALVPSSIPFTEVHGVGVIDHVGNQKPDILSGKPVPERKHIHGPGSNHGYQLRRLTASLHLHTFALALYFISCLDPRHFTVKMLKLTGRVNNFFKFTGQTSKYQRLRKQGSPQHPVFW